MNLNGKAAIVTGGGTGLGRVVSLALAKEGCNVAINYSRSEAEAFGTMKEVTALGVKAIAVKADVSQADQVKQMVEQVQQAFGRIDVLVNNAGTTVFVPMQDLDAITEDIWDRIQNVNVKGAFLCSKTVAPIMRQQKFGRIVNTASVAGLKGNGSSLPYSVSKHALVGLTRCLAVALGPDILVNAVCPGLMLTRWWAGRSEESIQRSKDRALTKREAALGDVAAAVLALVKNDSITGEHLVVDGGAITY